VTQAEGGTEAEAEAEAAASPEFGEPVVRIMTYLAAPLGGAE
jgi:hypothetical protein